jgi:hypothetical protein
MSADQQEGTLKPITPTRVAEELTKLSAQRQDGTLDADEYEHRFARMIGELRDRRIDGSRAEILATLTPLFEQGVVSAQDWRRLTRQLGLA